MNSKKINISFHFCKQDSSDRVLLAFFLLLPFFSLFPHTRWALLGSLCLLLLFPLCLRPLPKRVPLWPFIQPADTFYFLYLAVVLSGVVISPSPLSVLSAALLSLFRFVPRLYPKKERWLFALTAGGGIAAVSALLQYLRGEGSLSFSDTERFGDLARAGGLFQNPNTLAAFLLPLFFLSLFAWTDGKKGKRLPYALLCFLLFSGIVVSYSRGGWLALLLLLLLFLVYKFGFFKVTFVLVSLLPLLTLFLPSSIEARFFSIFSPDSSVRYRFSLWKSVFRLPPSSLLLGLGEGKEALFRALSPYMAAGLERVEHTHSLFLRFLTANGLLGLCLLLLSLLSGRKHRSQGVRFALLSVFLFGIFDDPLYSGQNEVLFWLLTGML